MTLLRLSADKQQKEVWSSRLRKWLHDRFGVYIEDFRFQPEESTVEAEEPLSAKRWVSGGPENIGVWFWLAGKGSHPPCQCQAAWLPCSINMTVHADPERTQEDGGTFVLFSQILFFIV